MTNLDPNTNSTVIETFTEDLDWKELYRRIGVVAYQRTGYLVYDVNDDENFNRGARALRALVGAADLVRRMRRADEEEKAANDGNSKQVTFTEEELRKIYRTVSDQVEAIAARDVAANAAEADLDDDVQSHGECRSGGDVAGESP